MNESLSPEELQQLIAGYVLGDLSPEEAEQIRHFIGENPEIMAEVRALQEILSLLPYSLPQAEPSNGLRAKIVDAADRFNSVDSPKRGLSWQKIVAAAIALAAVVLAANNYYLRQELKLARERDRSEVVALLEKADSRIYELAGTKDATGAAARIIYNPTQNKGFLLVSNLSEVKPEQVYRLWAIVGDDKIACADFRTDTSGSAIDRFTFAKNVCNDARATLAVTRESFPAPAQPLGSIVLLQKS